MNANNIKNILVIGAKGGLSRILIKILKRNYPYVNILGVDSRSIKPAQDERITYQKIDYRRNAFEKLFRENQFDIVYHLGRVSQAQTDEKSLAERLDKNIIGTNHILGLCLESKVKKVIIMSTYHVYGANPDNPVYLDESYPLRASINHSELRDVVEMDQLATNWMWKNKDLLDTIVLRPCSIIGPQINNVMSLYLKSKFAPTPIDFNPIFQFVHEFDMANILFKSIEVLPTGVYNVADNETISISKAKEIMNNRSFPVPFSVIGPISNLINKVVYPIPKYMVDYLKYSCVISNSLLLQHFDESPFRFKPIDILEQLSK